MIQFQFQRRQIETEHGEEKRQEQMKELSKARVRCIGGKTVAAERGAEGMTLRGDYEVESI